METLHLFYMNSHHMWYLRVLEVQDQSRAATLHLK